MKRLIREEVYIMTKQNIRIRQIALMLISLLMIFSSTFVSNAAVNNDNTISPYYVNISNRSAKLSISGIKADCTASVQSNKSVNLKIKMELQKEKSSGYETVETWTSSKTGAFLASDVTGILTDRTLIWKFQIILRI